MSANTCTHVQLDAAMDAIWADMEARYNTIEDVKARLAFELWGVPMPPSVPAAAPVAEPMAAPVAGPVSESESTESKRGRKKGPMTEEAKAKMVAKRAATIAAKAAGVVPPPPSPVAAVAAPLRIKAPKVKMSKEERSEAAKARYAAMPEEAKAAIRERLVKARQAAKEAKA
jgi:hypothetical protein